MIKILLLTCFTSQFYCCAALFRDFLNQKQINYEKKENFLRAPLYNSDSVSVQYIVISGEQTMSNQLLNANIESVAMGMLTSSKVRDDLLKDFYETRTYQELEGLESKTFTVLSAETDVLSLCNDIVIISFGINYVTEMLHLSKYTIIRYFDAKTGREVSKKQILDDSKIAKFISLVNSRIPEKYKGLISLDEIENGNGVFCGAGFYYILQGSLNNDLYLSGIPSVYVRLSLEEVKPYLNIGGPFGIYTTYTTGTANRGMPEDFYEVDYPNPFISNLHLFESDPWKVLNRPIEKAVCMQKIGDSFVKHHELFYDSLGRTISQLIYTAGGNYLKENISYSYFPDGKLKSVCRYTKEKYSDNTLERRWNYDQQGNLWYNSIISGTHSCVSHYVYFGDLIIEDSYDKNGNDVHYFLSSYLFEMKFGELMGRGMHNDENTAYRAEKRATQLIFMIVISLSSQLYMWKKNLNPSCIMDLRTI